MTGETPDIFEEDLMLAEVAKLDLVLARRLHAKAMDEDDNAELCNLTRAYARATRSMRQNLALLSRQKTERAKAAREAAQHEAWQAARAAGAALKAGAEPTPDPAELARAERIEDLQEAVSRISWRAAAGSRKTHTANVLRFDRELEDWWDEPDFLDFGLDTVVRHATRVLGLPQDLAETWEDLSDPPFFVDPAPSEPRAPDRLINWPPEEAADNALDDQASPDASAESSA